MANEQRLIDANVLKALFDERYDDAFMQSQTRPNIAHWEGYSIGVNWGRNTIEEAPTVYAVEVVRGYWKEWWCEDYITYFHKCSVCGEDALTKEETAHDEVLSNYCPNCGAKMDGGNEDA